ncbi:hypothetical protein BOTCAL_0139g00090 [Botryotinia calthae]|uniref:Major facilitator superfamily (MFS) profile domain-containing protein n=1 Tax=Botryotinia calthae TaxID=38488 RepID=A0A4Y8D3Q3_9HELO|nr:hypothetical protein BOTCAL_0139g00090 [Botryotinia calthae]
MAVSTNDEEQPLLAGTRNTVDSTCDRNGSEIHDESFSSSKNAKGMTIERRRLKFIFPALAIGIFLAACDQTIIVSSYAQIGSDLNELDKIAWLATAYLCTTTSFQPLYGKLGDIFGSKACIVFAYSMFGFGAMLCGLARNMNQLIVARALTGIGAGGIITVVSILLSNIVTLEERGIWQGYVNMVFACGAGLGAPLGGILTDAIGWRWAFIAQGPLCAIAVLLISALLRLPAETRSQKAELKRVDFLGAASLIFCLILLLVFLDRLASDKGNKWESYSWLVGSAVLFLIFLSVEKRYASDPLTPLHLLFGREFLGAYLALAFGNVAWYGIIFYVPLLYQVVGHFPASIAGALLLPGIGSGIIGGFVGGAILKRREAAGFFRLAIGSYPLVTTACMGIALGASIFWTGAPVVAVVVVVSISLFIGGLGNGGGLTATLVVVVVVASPEDQAIVTACVYLYRQLGTTIGLAIISLVFRRALAKSLIQRLLNVPELRLDTEEVLKGVGQSLKYLNQLPLEGRIIVEEAYGDACIAVFLMCAALAICAVVSSVFINEERAKHHKTSLAELQDEVDEENR